MEIVGLKRDHLLKTEQKVSHLKLIESTGHNYQKKDSPVLNKTYGHS